MWIFLSWRHSEVKDGKRFRPLRRSISEKYWVASWNSWLTRVMEWSSKILEIHKKYKNLSFEKSISSFEKFDSVPNWHKDRTRVRIMFGTLDAVTMEQGAFKYHHYCLTLEITNRWNLMCMWIVDIKTIDVSIKSTKMLGRK